MSRRYLITGLLAVTATLVLAGGCGSDDSAGKKTEPQGTSVTIVATQGGVVETPDKRLLLVIPPGALAEDTKIVVTPLAQAELHPTWTNVSDKVIAPYKLEPDGLEFTKPAGIVFTLDESELAVGTAESPAIAGIYSTTGAGSGELLSAGIVGLGAPAGKKQVIGSLIHFSQAAVIDLGMGSMSGDCKLCEVGGPYNGVVGVNSLGQTVPPTPSSDALTTTGPVTASWNGSWASGSRSFQYSCAEPGTGSISAKMAWQWTPKQTIAVLEDIFIHTPEQVLVAEQAVSADVECRASCSKANFDQCESDADCGPAERCHAACMCVCDPKKGAECLSNADCPGTVCVTSQCKCGAPSCAFPPTTVGEIANMLDVDLDTAACLVIQATNIVHSSAAVAGKNVAFDHTTVRFFWYAFWSAALTHVNKAFNNSTFHCGDGPNGYTLCPSPADPVPEGEMLVLVNQLYEPIVLGDTKNLYQYAFVFDADDDPTNNYQPAAGFPNDFFKDTDRWYEANYDPTNGWSLKVSDATGGTPKPATTHARIIIRNDTLTLVVPKSELAAAKPKFRVTAFRHTGDFGINPPHDWDGSVWPAVADGLQTPP